MAIENGVIDITELVNMLRSSFITAVTKAAEGALASQPYTAWLVTTPLVRNITHAIIEWVVRKAADFLHDVGYFLATAIRKAGQAHEYIDHKKVMKNLPKNITAVEYKKYEDQEMSYFKSLVMVTK